MAKRPTVKDTIVTCPFIQKQCEDSLAAGIQKMWSFVYQQKGNNRSSSKTDDLHAKLESVIYSSFGSYIDHYKTYFSMSVEKLRVKHNKSNKIKKVKDMFGKNFNVDMSLEDKNGNLHTIFLLKAPLTSLNKNTFNMINSHFGEIIRFFGNPENKHCKLVFVNFIPVETFSLNGKCLKKEKVNYIGLTQGDVNSPLQKSIIQEEYKRNIYNIDIHYDLELGVDLKDIHDEEMLKKVITLVQHRQFIKLKSDTLKPLYNYIESFMDENKLLFV